jgi:hypothetical protein
MKSLFFACSFIILIFCSCQKETSVENGGSPTPPPPPATPADTILLKSFIVLDTTKPAPADTQFIYRYSYDNLKRCTLITVIDYPNAQTGFINNYFTGNDTLIARQKLFTPGSADSTVEFFTYSAGGQMLSDSLVDYSSSGNNSLNYTYVAANNKVNSIIHSNGQPFLLGSYIIQKDGNGNIISELDSSFLYQAATSTYPYNSTTTNSITYDTKPCPFYKVYPKRLVVVDFENFATDYVPLNFHFLQKNNTLSHVRTSSPSGPGANNETYQFTYKATGYPATVIYKDVLFGDVLKGIYGY